MKVTLTICFIFYCIITLLLCVSIVGLILLIREDHNCDTYQGEGAESAWLKIGKQLVNKIVNL